MEPECPPHYICNFSPQPPPEHHWQGPWWETDWGIVVSILGVIGLTVAICWAVYYLHETHVARLQDKRQRDQRAYELAIEEQRTIQADAAKGDPEMLKLIRQRSI